MSMIWNDLDDHDIEPDRLRSLMESAKVDDGSPVSELKDELYDLWEQSYWKKRQWNEVSPFGTRVSAE
jgi:hypothetical protein